MNPVIVQNNKATRSSLACLPCRSRHLKCDGKKPCCSRCAETANQCDYPRSRRGGLSRSAWAERRKRLAAAEGVALDGHQSPQWSPDKQRSEGLSSRSVAVNFHNSHRLLDGISIDEGSARIASPAAINAHVVNIDNDSLIDAYYSSFHKSHPFIPPQKHLTRLYQDPSRQSSLRALIAILRLIGYIFRSREWPTSLKEYAEACLTQISPTDAVNVQFRLLYSMALFWYGYEDDARSEMDAAIRLAVDLQMFCQTFAEKHGGEDLVMRESWRRTWWTLYIVDTYYAGTLGTMKSELWDIESTAELPCEELDYESGEVPEPRSLQDFDCLEFASDSTKFSSFAYLVGAVRCTASAISTTSKVAFNEDSGHMTQAVDFILDGWLRLLPKNCRNVMDKFGKIDELMFQAHLIIHIATIALHRPFSDLKFSPVEDISSCARGPPSDTPAPEPVNIHTVRVLRSAEAQIRLLALPVRQFHQTPFITCMVNGGALALLSACKFLLKGKDLMIARAQIRVTIGCLKALGEVWPRTAKNVQEVQNIAHHVLGLGSRTASESHTPGSNEVPCLSEGEGQGSLGTGTDASISDTSSFPSLGFIEALNGWYSPDDLNPDPPWVQTLF